jgi:acetyl-CoA acyltransferase 1
VNDHFGANSNYNGGQVGPKRDDDVVIIGMARTAMTKAKRGAQKDTPLEAMLKPVFEATIKQSGVNPKEIEEVVVGNVLSAGSAATMIRMAMFLAGIPETASCQGINRMCSSGLQSVATIANAIKAGDIKLGIGGGVESMSHYDMMGQVEPDFLSEQVFENPGAQSCLLGMGITSENVAAKFGVTREV